MADVEQTEKMIPIIMCEISLGQFVCGLALDAVDTTMTFNVIHRRLGLQSDHVKTTCIIHSAQRTCTRFAWFATLA